MRKSARGALAVIVASCALASSARARADEAPPSAERLKAAAEEYDRGRRAFLANDFDGAAVHFENAYRDAPRAETLRLAIRARKNAKEPARAATLAATAQERYPNDAATMQLAKETLDETAPLLAELAVTCMSECGVTADGRVLTETDALQHRLFLDPGSHELGVSFKGGSVARHIDAKQGAREALSFGPPVAAPASPAAIVVAPLPPAPARDASGKPLSPIVFFVAAGLTVALGAATIISGIEAENHPGKDAVRAACAGQTASCPEYQDGKDAERRTNILLGVTVGAAAITAVTGILLTRWMSPASHPAAVKVGAAPLPGGGMLAAGARF